MLSSRTFCTSYQSAKMALMMKRSAVAARPAVSRKAVVTCVARQSWLPGSEIPKHLDSGAALSMAGNFGERHILAVLFGDQSSPVCVVAVVVNAERPALGMLQASTHSAWARTLRPCAGKSANILIVCMAAYGQSCLRACIKPQALPGIPYILGL